MKTPKANDPDMTRGLYQKYRVERVDGSSEPGGKHEHCEYFVLDLQHDPFASVALMVYATEAEAHGYNRLADSLRQKLFSLEPSELAVELDTGQNAVERWQEAQNKLAAAVADATDAVREAARLSKIPVRELARRSKLSPAAVSELLSGKMENVSSYATLRLLNAIRGYCK